MIPDLIKKPLRFVRNTVRVRQTTHYIEKIMSEKRTRELSDFNVPEFKDSILGFIDSMRTDDSGIHFRYSAQCDLPTLYSSVYECMSYSILGELQSHSDTKKMNEWAKYLDSFQSPDDGLFYDPVVSNDIYKDSDWWGARHLALHIIVAYNDLGAKPRYPFKFLYSYYDINKIGDWLDAFDWHGSFAHSEDIDNKIMNIGCLLQYQRDTWGDEKAGEAVAFLQKYLKERMNPETGMWGKWNTEIPYERSRMVQFAYHLFPLFFYDGLKLDNSSLIVDHILKTQNKFGGFGVQANSSACEDIDSIDILCRLAADVPERKAEIDAALQKAWKWVLFNQVEDGGFVFRLNEGFTYGHPEMSSRANHGAMFPTWFRLLALAYLARYFSVEGFHILSRLGLEI